MSKKRLISLGILALLIFSIFSVFATANVQGITITTPSANYATNLTGNTVEIGGAITVQGAIPTLYNVTVRLTAASVASPEATAICTNTSLSGTVWSCKAQTSTLNDNSTAAFNVTHGNSTNGGGDNGGENQNSSTATVLIDNSAPTVDLTRFGRITGEAGETTTTACDVNDNVDSNLNVKINLANPVGDNASTNSDTENANVPGGNNSLQFVPHDLIREGQYTYYCTATNSNGLAKQNTTTVIMDSTGKVTKMAIGVGAAEKPRNMLNLILLLGGAGGLIFGLAIAGIIITSKKKR